jgi:drug/metabolite transporter, DME family
VRWNVAVAALAASWGLVSIIVREVDLDAAVLVFFRCVVAVLTIGAVLVAARGLGAVRLGRSAPAALFLGTTLGIHWFCFFETIKLASVAFAVLAAYLAPIAVAAIAPLILPESRSRVALLALPPAVAGLALVALSGGNGVGVRPLAVATGLGTAATYAALVIGTKWIAGQVSAAGLALWNYSLSGLVMLPIVVFADRIVPRAGEIPYLLVLGVVFTALSGYLYIALIRKVTAQAIGVLAYLEPVSAALLAWAVVGEPLTWQVLVGGALIIAGGIAVVAYEPADPAGVGLPGD